MVFILCALGWLFDCMGQRIFIMARESAINELLGPKATDGQMMLWGGLSTCILMIGWGLGGILFGMFSDKYGRVKGMLATLVAYTVFSGLAGLAHSGMEFLIYRFLCGMGVGGMFGSATTLLAESVPPRFRTLSLGSMQALSALGNMGGSTLSLSITPGMENFWGNYSGWQVLFFVTVCPVFLAVPILLVLKEPEVWKKAKAEAAKGTGKSVGATLDLFRDPRWRRSTLVGICLGVSGMVGLWGIAFFSPELVTTALKNRPLQAAELVKPVDFCRALSSSTNAAMERVKGLLAPEVVKQVAQAAQAGELSAAAREALVAELNRVMQKDMLYDADAFKAVKLKKATNKLLGLVKDHGQTANLPFLNRQLLEQTFHGCFLSLQKKIDTMRGGGLRMQDVGSVVGMFAFTFVASYFNRRKAFLWAFVLCMISVAYVFYALKTEGDIYWMLTILGFTTLSVFAGYSIYFPELFPARLRGTGVGFCYNTVRFVTAPFPFLFGWLSSFVSFRTVAMAMASIYLVGIVALLWAPETKDQPLPED